jgi:hypothetical protein
LSGTCDISAMSSPANLTDSASTRSRLPLQVAHTAPTMYCAARRFIAALAVVANECRTWRRALVKVPM